MTHLFGGCRAGRDAATSVVDPTLKVHGVDGLYVMDASVFPINTGVNPQHSIMSIATVAAARWRRSAAELMSPGRQPSLSDRRVALDQLDAVAERIAQLEAPQPGTGSPSTISTPARSSFVRHASSLVTS